VVARPVMIDRTRPVTCGCLLEMTRHWHCDVRFVKRARPVEVSRVRAVRDLRVQSWTLARPVVLDRWRVVGDH
jgi:hypothetical protein